MLDSGWLTFQEDKPNIENNSLSGHGNASTNAIMQWEEHSLLNDARKVWSSMKFIFETLCKIGLLEYETKSNDKCGIHPGDEHCIEDCLGFKQYFKS